MNILHFVNTVRSNIFEQKLIQTKDHVALATSGGQDSTCLLFVLYLLKDQFTCSFDSFWVHHFWQTSSFFTMLHTSRCSFSFSCAIRHVLPLQDVISEKSAREWRNALTQRLCFFYSYDVCLQGHNKSDRIESITFNLVRGAGLPGVSTLKWQKTQYNLSCTKFYPTRLQLLHQTHTTYPPQPRCTLGNTPPFGLWPSLSRV